MSELKPCPCCGGEGKKSLAFVNRPGKHEFDTSNHSVEEHVTCQQCFLSARSVAAWNARAEKTCTLKLRPQRYKKNRTVLCCSECETGIMYNAKHCHGCGARIVKEGDHDQS